MDYVDVPAPASALIVQAAFSGEFVDKIIAAESSGNPQARPCDRKTGKLLSSAYGAGQFIAATWLAMVRKYRPDLTAKSEDEILALRADFELSREMTIKFTEENRTYLIKKGLDPTDAALYLAHFAGANGAARLLKAHRDTPVEDILSPEAIAANPFLEGHTPATLYAWAKKKMNIEVGPVVKQAAVSYSDKVTPHKAIPGCSAEADVTEVAAASPEEPETSGAKDQPSKLSQAVRLIVGGVARLATKT